MSKKDTPGVALHDVRGLLKDVLTKLESPDFRKELGLLCRGELERERFLSHKEVALVRERIREYLAWERLDTPTRCVEADSFARQKLWESWHEKVEWKGASISLTFDIGFVAGRPICISLRFEKVGGDCVCFYTVQSSLADWDMAEKFLKLMFPMAGHSNAANFRPTKNASAQATV